MSPTRGLGEFNITEFNFDGCNSWVILPSLVPYEPPYKLYFSNPNTFIIALTSFADWKVLYLLRSIPFFLASFT